MYHVKKVRWGIFILTLLVLIGLSVSALVTQATRENCLGLPVETELRHGGALADSGIDPRELFLFNGEKAAVDAENGTIYISQKIDSTTTVAELTGKLSLTIPQWELYFLDDSGFQNLKQSTAQGHAFSLAVDNGTENYVYQVVFTTLPLIRLDGSDVEEGADSFYGDLCLWNGGEELPSVSDVAFHIRGGSSKWQEKKSWKLSLKDGNGKKSNLSLLGMGSDDDWILNAMVFDDAKVNEKFFTELWNQIVDNSDWNYPMAACEYVEVVYNGAYQGLYLLQRRVDKKYLHLTGEDALLKGQGDWTSSAIQDSYEIKNTDIPEQKVWELMQGCYTATDASIMNPDNYADVSILLQFGSLVDNSGYKNMYYLLKNEQGEYRLYLIPWDTDMGLGVTWVTQIEYDYQASMGKTVKRREYDAVVSAWPDLDQRIVNRWQQLRQKELSEDNVKNLLEEQIYRITDSGAFDRNNNRWSLRYGGQDTHEAVLRYVQERLRVLDAYYSET